MARGLAAFSGSKYTAAFEAILDTGDSRTADHLRGDLKDALVAIDRPVVVLVDDLDRLDRDEIQAVFRAIRLVAELNIAHVIAFDRAQIVSTLFPQDTVGDASRDFLAKLINVEITIPPPRRELQLALLDSSLDTLWRAVGQLQADATSERMRRATLAVFCEALPTPREIKRVAAATAADWSRIGKHVNLFDLLVVKIIQYRFPDVYSTMLAHPQWFTNLRWTSDVDIGIRHVTYEADAKGYVESLRDRSPSHATVAVPLLGALLPGVPAVAARGGMIERDRAREERRIVHPDIYPRYFGADFGVAEVPEATLQEAAAALVALTEGPRRQAGVTRLLLTAVAEGRIRSLIDQWHLVEALIAAGPDMLLRDFVVGIAHASDQLPGEQSELLSPRQSAAYKAMALIARASTVEIATDIAEEAIVETADLGFAGSLVFYATDADASRQRDAYGNRCPNGGRIQARLTERLLDRYVANGYLILSANDDSEITTALYRVSPHALDEVLLRELRTQPQLLSKFLGFAIILDAHSSDPSDVSVLHDGLASLAKYIDLAKVHATTAALDLAAWNSPNERALVQYFRNWIGRQNAPPDGSSVACAG